MRRRRSRQSCSESTPYAVASTVPQRKGRNGRRGRFAGPCGRGPMPGGRACRCDRQAQDSSEKGPPIDVGEVG